MTRPLALPALLALAAAAAACGGEERAASAARASRDSAVATERATLEAWREGHVSHRFARLALEAARTRVEDDRRRLAARPAGAVAAAALLADLELLSARLARRAEAARRNDLQAALR